MCDLGSAIAIGGLALKVTGQVSQGVAEHKAANENIALIETQKQNEALITSTKDLRSRRQFRSQIRKQFAEVGARGVDLDSPTAVLLGQQAASEMSFQSQAIRSSGAARQEELSAQQRIIRARGKAALFQGGLSAAGSLLTAAPDLWPELAA